MTFLHQACLQRDRRENVALHLLGESTTLSYGALDATSLTLALHLQAIGVGKGARIAVLSGLSAEFVVALLAVSRCGAAFSPINTSLRGSSLSSLLKRLRPDAVITTEANVQRAVNVLGERFTCSCFQVGVSTLRKRRCGDIGGKERNACNGGYRSPLPIGCLHRPCRWKVCRTTICY